MQKNKHHISTLAALLLVAALLLAGCSSAAGGSAAAVQGSIFTTSYSSNKVKDEDLDATWNIADATHITLKNDSITVQGEGASAAGSIVTLVQAGTYVVTGTLADGQIIIDAPDTALVRLVLNGVDIHCDESAPISCQLADKLLVILADGTTNTLSDGEAYVFPDAETNEPSATLFSKADLTINGTGTLQVQANYNNGIGTKDDLILVSGIIQVDAANHAIRGRDSVTALEPELTLTAGGDGIQANNNTAEDKGWIELYAGTYTITSAHDGIQAETTLAVYGGSYDITAGGGAAAAPERTEEMPGMGGGWPGGFGAEGTLPEGMELPEGMTWPESGGFPGGTALPEGMTLPEGMEFPEGMTLPEGTELPEGTTPPETESASNPAEDEAETTPAGEGTEAEATATESYKGMKAVTGLAVSGGTITIDAQDDALHTNGSLTVSGGTISLATGDDGIHADDTVTIEGDPRIDIRQCYEGIEGAFVNIAGGEISIVASDDGLNAAGGDAKNMPGMAGNYAINISGGTVILEAGTDGLDSNGDVNISGGLLMVHMTNINSIGGDGALDQDGNFTITGGTVVGAGGNGLVTIGGGFSAESTQPMLDFYYSQAQSAGTMFTLSNAEGNALLSFAPRYDYSCVVVSTPELRAEATYTVSTGGTAQGTETGGLYTNAATDMQALVQVTLTEGLTAVQDTGEARAATGMGGGMPGGFGGGRRQSGT